MAHIGRHYDVRGCSWRPNLGLLDQDLGWCFDDDVSRRKAALEQDGARIRTKSTCLCPASHIRTCSEYANHGPVRVSLHEKAMHNQLTDTYHRHRGLFFLLASLHASAVGRSRTKLTPPPAASSTAASAAAVSAAGKKDWEK